ncbi:MAG TPA: hypothetical protein VFI28_06085 [Candidatus Limnocylindrales bacterium]|nr:hypothetical protein [Candidatus Limnocylindrales bacterium]
MAILGALFAAAGRVVGRVANMALGWATILLFGQVPQSKQLLLTFITLGSIAWIAAILGVIVPSIGTFLLALVPRPAFVPELWVRLVMLAVAIVLPLAIGIGSVFLVDAADRPKGRGLVVQVLRGYPYAAVLSLTLVFLGLVALVRKGRSLVKRWQDAHVPMIVKPGAYEEVAAALERALDQAGLAVERSRAPRVLELPARILAAVGGAGVKGLVPDELVELKAHGLEVMLHPSDVALLGEKPILARARAAMTTRLTNVDAYLTATSEAQKVEDRLLAIARQPTVSAADFEPIDRALASLVVPADEWETLYRLRLQVENERRLPTASRPGLPPSAASNATRGPADVPPADRLGWVAALAALGLLAADVALAVVESVRGDRRDRRRGARLG